MEKVRKEAAETARVQVEERIRKEAEAAEYRKFTQRV